MEEKRRLLAVYLAQQACEAGPIFAWDQLVQANGHLNLKPEATVWTARTLIWCQICSLKMQEIALPGS